MDNNEPDSPPPLSLDIKHILLLDDDPDVVSVLKDTLESRHFIVTTAINGVEGLRQVMSQDFDIILCDLMMPTMPGDMFYIAVQRTKPQLVERFIFITGCSENPKVAAFLQTVTAPVIIKPVTSEEVIRVIDEVLKQAAPLVPPA